MQRSVRQRFRHKLAKVRLSVLVDDGVVILDCVEERFKFTLRGTLTIRQLALRHPKDTLKGSVNTFMNSGRLVKPVLGIERNERSINSRLAVYRVTVLIPQVFDEANPGFAQQQLELVRHCASDVASGRLGNVLHDSSSAVFYVNLFLKRRALRGCGGKLVQGIDINLAWRFLFVLLNVFLCCSLLLFF